MKIFLNPVHSFLDILNTIRIRKTKITFCPIPEIDPGCYCYACFFKDPATQVQGIRAEFFCIVATISLT